MMTDPIADMLSRLRNAAIARKDRTEIPHSSIKEHLLEILKQEGYISDFRIDENPWKTITVFLRYSPKGRQSAFKGLRRKSRPGLRVYVGYHDIPKVLNGLGVAILSTSRGVMTDKRARAEKIGGEIMCEVW